MAHEYGMATAKKASKGKAKGKMKYNKGGMAYGMATAKKASKGRVNANAGASKKPSRGR